MTNVNLYWAKRLNLNSIYKRIEIPGELEKSAKCTNHSVKYEITKNLIINSKLPVYSDMSLSIRNHIWIYLREIDLSHYRNKQENKQRNTHTDKNFILLVKIQDRLSCNPRWCISNCTRFSVLGKKILHFIEHFQKIYIPNVQQKIV